MIVVLIATEMNSILVMEKKTHTKIKLELSSGLKRKDIGGCW